jgi:hypothetical protein
VSRSSSAIDIDTVQASLEQRQRFQQLFFPKGIVFDGKSFCPAERQSLTRYALSPPWGW